MLHCESFTPKIVLISAPPDKPRIFSESSAGLKPKKAPNYYTTMIAKHTHYVHRNKQQVVGLTK